MLKYITHEAVTAALASEAVDDEGPRGLLVDIIDCQPNLQRTIVRAALQAAAPYIIQEYLKDSEWTPWT